MFFRPLGNTGIEVSALAMGTVSLGINYGIKAPGQFGRPDETEAIRLLHKAADAGINIFDTAPAYGESEHLLGKTIGRRQGCIIATKVLTPSDENGMPISGVRLKQEINKSIDQSLRNLRRDVLDIVQIHNATREIIQRGELVEALLQTKQQGKIRFLGASTYGEEASLAVIEAGCFSVLQVAYNILDQRMSQRVFPVAEKAGVAIMSRSVLLKGALSAKAQWLPQELEQLRQVVHRTKDVLNVSWRHLPHAAIRFCLSSPNVSCVLVGVRTEAELTEALEALESGPLSADKLAGTKCLAITEERLLNPSYWSVP